MKGNQGRSISFHTGGLAAEGKEAMGREEINYHPTSGAKGSNEKEYDKNAPQAHDGRSTAATSFQPIESDDFNKWQRLRQRNDGNRSVSQGRRRAAGRRRDAQTWCSRLEFSDHQTSRVIYLLSHFAPAETDADRENAEQSASEGAASDDPKTTLNDLGNRSAEAGILAIIAHVANDVGRPVIPEATLKSGNEYPHRNTEVDDSFRDICEACKVSLEDVSGAYNSLLAGIEEIEVE